MTRRVAVTHTDRVEPAQLDAAIAADLEEPRYAG